METSDIISILALAISCVSSAFLIYNILRDRANIRTRAEFFPAYNDEDGPGGPPLLTLAIFNHGRRDVLLEYLYFEFGRKTFEYAETTWESDSHGRFRFGEGESHSQDFDPDCDGILTDENGNPPTRVFFQDSLRNRYVVQNARREIKKYLHAVRKM
ncbi:MAG: hypothetical protein ACK2UB_05605 [Anaerolineales bacterium]